MQRQTPGVYVEEISTLPPSVAEVSTAVPAFFGYTELHSGSGPMIARVDNFLEFKELFGGPAPQAFELATSAASAGGPVSVDSLTKPSTQGPSYLLYYAIDHYFKNQGGGCWVVSVGPYDPQATGPAPADFEDGLELLAKEDEPTLIVLTDAVNLAMDEYRAVGQSALAQCGELGDRFVIFDVPGGDVGGFRKLDSEFLKYGAAYHPYLKTVLQLVYEEQDVTVTHTEPVWSWTASSNALTVTFEGQATAPPPTVEVTEGSTDENTLGFAVTDGTLTVQNGADKTGAEIKAAWDAWVATGDSKGFAVSTGDSPDAPAGATNGPQLLALTSRQSRKTLDQLETEHTALYNQVKAELAGQRMTLPPSSAVAGIYARVDRNRGVWKAPANVSVAATVGPVEKITDIQQDGLNVDATSGKSINAIRAFTGRGTVVWGARTLAGNDNEWRYVSVRRLFNLIEESCRKATAFAVFEANDMTTWLKVQGMIESYLFGLWERGALAGPTPESAYFVNVGLRKTMTPQDVLEGRMKIEIGVAAVRPAEFIYLRFTHKLQEA